MEQVQAEDQAMTAYLTTQAPILGWVGHRPRNIV